MPGPHPHRGPQGGGARPPRIGLVLGAGGMVGQAFHAGTLAALEHDLGWDARSAEVIVGTSAGSVTGAALRLGVRGLDLAADAVAMAPSDEGRRFLAALDLGAVSFPAFELRQLLRPWHLPSRRLLAEIARRPWAFRPGVVALTLVPPGWVDLSDQTDALVPLLGPSWPVGPRVCATRADTGARVVFGEEDHPEVRLDRAVSASCAIPGYFQPVEIDGVRHLDGGVHSATNADCLRLDHLDLVIVSSPMSAAAGRARSADAVLRWSNHRRLEHEVSRLRAAGTTVVTFEPTSTVLADMGLNAMANDRSDRVMREAFFAAGARMRCPDVVAALAPIARQPTPLGSGTSSGCRPHERVEPAVA